MNAGLKEIPVIIGNFTEQQERERRRLQKRVDDAEKKVEKISAEMRELEGWLSTPSGAQNQEMFTAYGKLQDELANAEQEWESAMEVLETGIF